MRVPANFVRFAHDNDLAFLAQRKLPTPASTTIADAGFGPYTQPMLSIVVERTHRDLAMSLIPALISNNGRISAKIYLDATVG